MSDGQLLHLDSATTLGFDSVPDIIDPEAITPLTVTKTLNNTLYQPVNFLNTHSVFGSPFTIGAAGGITVAGYNAITSFLTSAATVITDGTILASNVGTTHANGIVLLTDGGVVTNQAQGKITGGYLGIYAKDFATITNAGIIEAGGFGVFLDAGGDVTNSGQIIVPTVFNRTVTSYNQTGIDLHGAGTITNLAGGTVVGVDAAGIKFGVGKIVNNGLLEGSLLGAYLGNGGVVVNTGIITANRNGNNAVVLYRGGSLSNAGFVYGEGAFGYGAVFGNGAGNITNSGTIRGGNEAIQAYASGNITNTRLIEGANIAIAFEAATLDSQAVITNTGTITGGSDAIQLFASGRISNGAGGLIEGGTAGILFETTTLAETATLYNDGTIASGQGTAGIAINFGTAAASLTIGSTGTFIGQVIADGAAGNLLELTGTRIAVLAGIGTEITGFETIKFAAGAIATIAGDVAGLAAGQDIIGFTTRDEIILDGFAVTSASYVAKKGFDLFDGATKITLGTTGKLTGGFLLDESGGATTLAAIGATKTVGAGEIEILLSGGKQSNAVVSGGILEVYAGGKISGAAVSAGGLLEVFSGGSATGVHVSGGGIEELFSGGAAAGSVILNGGREIIKSGATATATTLAGGTLEISKGGTLENGLVILNSGGTLQLDGGAIVPGTFAVGVPYSDVLLLTGKSSKPLTGLGTAINGFQHITFAAGAAWGVEGNITGIANGEIFAGFGAGDKLTIQGFGGLSGTYSKGVLDLFNNGAKEVVTLGLAAGEDLLVSGANAVSTITAAAPGAAITVGAHEFEIVTAGAIAKKTVVKAGGVQTVNAGGTEDGTQVAKGGTLTVLAGGTASGGVVTAGGLEFVQGSAQNAAISGGSMTIAAGGTLNGATIAGGTLDLAAGSTLTGTIGFTAPGGHLLLTNPLPTRQIDGFIAGDVIQLAGFTATSDSYVAGIGLELSDGARTLTLDLAGSFTTADFAVTSIATGTKITLAGPPPGATTLSPATPVTTISSKINADGVIGAYTIAYPGPPAVKTITAALFGAAGTAFDVTNKSLIQSNGTSAYGAAIVLGSPGTITNLGTIIGGAGIENFGTAAGAYISNAKTLAATIGAGIYLQGSGSALNTGTITAATTGMLLGAGGYAYNSGIITAATGIVLAPNAIASYVYNAGQIDAAGTGILDSAPGSVSNTGTIRAGGTGVSMANSSPGAVAYNFGLISAATGIALAAGDTLITAGTIIGAGPAGAVSFASGAGNLLVIEAGARFTGGVSGGGGEMALAKGTATGTISLGAGQFSEFSTIAVDAGAVWDLAGTFTAAAGITLLNQGTIKLTASDRATIVGPVAGAGIIDLSKQALTLGGSVAASQRIAFSGTGETLIIGDAPGFAGRLEKFAAGDTIELAGISLTSITGSHFAAGILTLDEAAGSLTLTFASPASFHGDFFSLTGNAAGIAISVGKPAILSPSASGLAPVSLLHASPPPRVVPSGQSATGIILAPTPTGAGWLAADLFAVKATPATAFGVKTSQ